MLPSTSPASTSTNRLTPTPGSTTASASTEPRLGIQSTSAAVVSASDTTLAGVTTGIPVVTSGPFTAVSESVAGPPPPNQQSLYKRGPSSSHDGQSPESTGSLPSARDNVSDIPQDQRTKRRRTGAPGSRGVANLTPEQLAKKRANDREAQRAIRERTRNQIDGLEKRIQELTAQKPYQELQKVIREKEAAEAKIVELQSHMASVVALLQPLLPKGDTGTSTFTSPISAYNSIQSAQEQQQQLKQLSSYSSHGRSTPGAASTPQSGVESSRFGQIVQPSSQPDIDSHQHRTPNLNLGDERIRLDSLLDPSQRLSKMQTGANGAQDSSAYQHLPMRHDWSVAMHFGRDNDNSTTNNAPPPTLTQQYQSIKYAPDPPNFPQASWSRANIPIKHTPATCPLDHVLLDFMQERRQRAAEGVPTRELVGPEYPSIISLLNPVEGTWSHPVSKVFTDILATFPGICTVPEKVAVLYVMFVIMRWHISPTEDNFKLIPEFARPLEVQYTIPHPAWLDYLPFPGLRELFIRNYTSPKFQLDEIFVSYTMTISLNWPYEETDALIVTPDGSETIINPVFLRHLHRIDNWTLGDAFDQTCPEARGTYNIKSDGSSLNQNQTQTQNETQGRVSESNWR
ncbi:hypothetical protein F5B22DRAFT_61482 [Xylaria bambusicola]|uniref:uncharacterized protein n=1 Tax=Xylaria bambusicola TaxID=326684 RepID=UPI00200834CC|nr:uncharacterized protein F5B22DRAFT_61482 [Xylaria bambusicola]KAI0518424.1 hypothetical protein F5B22DRAFT_61482 [Xylaria bambusicola]